MRATRPTNWAVGALSACLAAFWLAGQATAAEAAQPAYVAKSDRLNLNVPKGDLLNRKPERAGPGRPAAAGEPDVTSRGTAARRLIDVAVRDDGVWINSFATRSMPLEGPDCAALSDDIVHRLALPAGAVERLAEEELMRQTRVCALNGSLLVTCYGGAATVSLRHPQHGDGCGD